MKCFLFTLVVLGLAIIGRSETNSPPESGMLEFHGTDLFEVVSVADVPIKQTLDMMERRLIRFAKSPLFSTSSLRLQDDEAMHVTMLFADSEFVFATWQPEADALKRTRRELAEERMEIISNAIKEYRSAYDVKSLVKGAVFSIIATILVWILFVLVIRLRKKAHILFERVLEDRKLFGILEGESLLMLGKFLTNAAQAVLFFWLAAVYINFVLSFFPWTFNVAATLFDWIYTPLLLFWNGFVGKLPDLFALAIIVVITRMVLKGFRYIFDQLRDGNLRVTEFYSDWADPSYRLVRFVVAAFALVAAWPYIPGSGSPAFKGISIFMGLLVSLGSTSVMGNIFSGLVITYMRPFVPGDFVEINETLGTVLDRRTFSTRIRTTKNEVVNIPNSAITANHIMNHSRRVKKDGVLLYSSVTIGYDVPVETVERLLLAAAGCVDGLLDTPEPFVLVTSLDDFYVTYELNAATRTPENRPRIYSNLHKQILSKFAKAGVEIMSPHYRHNRTGNESTIPLTNT